MARLKELRAKSGLWGRIWRTPSGINGIVEDLRLNTETRMQFGECPNGFMVGIEGF